MATERNVTRLRRVVAILALVGAGTIPAAAAPGGAVNAGQRAAAPATRIEDHFTAEEIQRAREYRGPRYAIGFTSMAVSLIVLGLLAAGPIGRAAGRWVAARSGGRWWIEVLLLLALVVAATTIADLPLSIARFRHDRSFGLITQSLGGHLADVGKAVGVQVLVGAAAASGFFFVARRLPVAWPAVAAVAAAVLTVVLVFAAPIALEPIFNRFTPVEAATRARVVRIAERAGVRVGDVLVADASRRTTRLNAYVSGLGATKRVVLYDTLLQRASPPEVDLVVAHELAHQANRDVLKGTMLAAGASVLAVLALWALTGWAPVRRAGGFAGPGDPRALPFFAFVLTLGALLASPVENAISRGMESAADRGALEYTHDPETAVRVETSLARENLSDLEPPAFVRWAFFTHPPPLERIQAALDWRAEHPGVPPIDAPTRPPDDPGGGGNSP